MAKKNKDLKSHYTLGIDLGGTKMAVALVSSEGIVIDGFKVPVDLKKEGVPAKTISRVISLMGDLVADLKRRYPLEFKNLKGIGLASAGPLNAETGKLIYPVNFPGWKIVPIQDLLQKELLKRKINGKVYFQNDAVAAAFAEGWIGGAQGLNTFGLVTVGTGIGTGIISHNKPCQTKGMGSEFGHLIIDTESLKAGAPRAHCSVEGIASGTGILRRAQTLGFSGTSVEELIHALDSGEEKYQPLFDDMALALGVLFFNLSIGFNLQGIWISGGLIKVKKLWFNKSIQHYQKLIQDFNPNFKTKIRISKSGNKAGVIGAARLPYS